MSSIYNLENDTNNNESLAFTWSHDAVDHASIQHQTFSATSPAVNWSDYERVLEDTRSSSDDHQSRLQQVRKARSSSNGFHGLTLAVEHSTSSLLNVTLSPMAPLHEPPASPVTDYNRALRELEELSREEEWPEQGLNSNRSLGSHLDECSPSSPLTNTNLPSSNVDTEQPLSSSSSTIAFHIQPSRTHRLSKKPNQFRWTTASTSSSTTCTSPVILAELVEDPVNIKSNFRAARYNSSGGRNTLSLPSSPNITPSSRRRRLRQQCDLAEVRASLQAVHSQQSHDDSVLGAYTEQSLSKDMRHQRRYATYSHSNPVTSTVVPRAVEHVTRSQRSSRSSKRSSSHSTTDPSTPSPLTPKPSSVAFVLDENVQRIRVSSRHVSHKPSPSSSRLHPTESYTHFDNGRYNTTSPSASPVLRHQLGSSFGTTTSLGDRSSEWSEFDEDQRVLRESKYSSSRSSQDSFPTYAKNTLLNPRRAASVMKSRRSRRYDSSHSDDSDYYENDDLSTRPSRSARSLIGKSARSSVVQLVVDGHAIADVPLDRLRSLLQLSEPNIRRTSKKASRTYA